MLEENDEALCLSEYAKSHDRGGDAAFWSDNDLIIPDHSDVTRMRLDVQSLMLNGDKQARRKLGDELPRFEQLSHLITYGIDDDDFARIVHCSSITHLHLERPKISSVKGIDSMIKLTHLGLGSASKLTNLGALSKLEKLVALTLKGRYQQIEHLRDVASVQSLESLSIFANDFKILRFPSISELTKLKKLKYLSFARVIFKDPHLEKLAELQKLEYFKMNFCDLKNYSVGEFKRLHQALPNLKNKMVDAAANDVDFQRKWKIC